ncbi:hypothetical protein L596_004251 [Steinernema carpocapsae]|uniref:UDENN domain-containing protein n=1 Tax=Steinernema carpocapsae TaxID=34508 RepID=A0A4U8UVB5_STECR|nr:hypothetical protein L596_004251 [Steinernema carpocapsae]
MALSSRLRTNVATLFDVFCEVGTTLGTELLILQKYPEDYTDENTLRSVCQFSFPCGPQCEDGAVQLFTFVLTDQQSSYTFAYCRYTPKNNSCLVILSALPWTSIFYKILNHLSNLMNNAVATDIEETLTRMYHTDIPSTGETLAVSNHSGTHKTELTVPDTSRLPTLKEDKFMLEFYNAVPEKLMIPLFVSLLKERRIIFTSRKLGQLSSCVFAAASLLYPFHWQSLFIPVLPVHLVDMLMAPMPFLIGVPKQTFSSLRLAELGEVVVVDLDEKTFESAHCDSLPSEVNSFLRSQLKFSSEMFLSDGLARSFLKTNVLLFGSYRLGFFRTDSSHEIKWDKEKFVDDQKNSLKPFLSSLLGTDGVQYLERFIDERLISLNSGRPISDEFEKEACLMDKRSGRGGRSSPETIQRAVNAVKENASDVVGVLKDKMSSMMIREKIGKLTPKELRRNKSFGGQRKKETSIDPMSFDTRQWEIGTASNVADTNGQIQHENSSSCSDLIDFSDPDPSPAISCQVPSQLVHQLQPSFASQTQSSTANSSGTRALFPPPSTSHSSPSLEASVKSKGHWEQFE